ncbi:dihydrodipicolinate synthase family protein [Arenibaculum pallidiluteum]|uniref:dihydrodipicolinate synthase family protein n=1 Tax=Arenibaculum pallidiluteum TaxID=2812559 RepID=UPI001A967142|nr:dihydrodipicolinate synthase family protein [Arenibaculum pallidiluteum]
MALLDESASGVYVIAVTPFRDDGSLDLESTDRMVDFYLERGVTGITVLGVMGEAPKLTAAESRLFVRRVLARLDGRIPCVVGVSSPGLASMRELASAVMEDGAAGVMVAPPSTLRTDDQIFGYFENVAETLGPKIPFVLQDFPLTTSVQIAPATLVRIIKALPSCVMVKHEDWPGLAKISALRAASEQGGMRRVSILVGNGGIFLPEEMGRGADGAMTGFAFPEMMVGVVEAFGRGDVERAHDFFDAYLPLARYEQQLGAGLAVRKYVLAKRGAIASAAQRKPGGKLSPADIAEVERLLARQEKRLKEIG